METIFLKIITGEILFIILLALMDTGILLYVYEALYTRPKTAFEKFMGSLLVDLFYIVGTSIVASLTFLFITKHEMDNVALMFGLFFAIIGKYLKK